MSIRIVLVANDRTTQALIMQHHLSSIGSPGFKHFGLSSNPQYLAASGHTHPSAVEESNGITIPWKIFPSFVDRLWSLFLVTLPGGNEEADAKDLIEAAVNNGVTHIVLLSTAYDQKASLTYSGWQTKIHIEWFLKKQIAAQTAHQISWTILQPVSYYDLINFGPVGEANTRATQQLRGNVRIDLVAMEDVAKAAARVLGDPQLYNGKSIVLIGDKLSYVEMNHIIKEEVGRDAPLALQLRYGFVQGPSNRITPSLPQYNIWHENGGYRVHPSLVRAAQPNMLSFRMWVKQSLLPH